MCEICGPIDVADKDPRSTVATGRHSPAGETCVCKPRMLRCDLFVFRPFSSTSTTFFFFYFFFLQRWLLSTILLMRKSRSWTTRDPTGAMATIGCQTFLTGLDNRGPHQATCLAPRGCRTRPSSRKSPPGPHLFPQPTPPAPLPLRQTSSPGSLTTTFFTTKST